MSLESETRIKVRDSYIESFGNEFIMVKAPGRINLIGEHTDYNNGFVLPAAVGQSIYFALGHSNDNKKCHLISLDLGQKFDFNLDEIKPEPADFWQNYILGVVAEVQKTNRPVKAFNLVFSGEVPQGSGMSSSAALECGTCFGINELFNLEISKLEMIKMAQMAEHNYAGVKCGIMDQFASMMGKEGQALLLDCQSLEYKHFPITLDEYALILCNSNVTHSLASSQYNVRRQQCEMGVQILRSKFPNVQSLRDASINQLDEIKPEMDESVYLRCKYIIEENGRVKDFTEALLLKDYKKVGQILTNAQHAMRYEYEITCPEIDFMADFAIDRDDVLGARMVGGGFGGCTINLIKKGAEDSLVSEMNLAYVREFNKEITPIPITISDGVSLL